MIAGLLNTIVGIWLVYVAVLNQTLLHQPWHAAVLGAAVIALSLWARSGERVKWFSLTTIILGALLLVSAIVDFSAPRAALFTFWSVFWIGLMVAVLALWSAIYRPAP